MGGKTSAASKNKWIASAYDRINLTVPKGQKEAIQAHAEARKESINGFINRAVNETICKDSGGFTLLLTKKEAIILFGKKDMVGQVCAPTLERPISVERYSVVGGIGYYAPFIISAGDEAFYAQLLGLTQDDKKIEFKFKPSITMDEIRASLYYGFQSH